MFSDEVVAVTGILENDPPGMSLTIFPPRRTARRLLPLKRKLAQELANLGLTRQLRIVLAFESLPTPVFAASPHKDEEVVDLETLPFSFVWALFNYVTTCYTRNSATRLEMEEERNSFLAP